MRIETRPLTRDQNKLIRRLLDSEAAAYKNHVVQAVESQDWERATRLTQELAAVTELFHVFVPDDMVDYYQKNPVRYRYYRFGCGRDARLQQLWGSEAPKH